jgi:hypothetical protein
MKYYAKVENGKVKKVIVAEPEFFDNFVDSSPGKWIETSKTLRKNYAAKGYSYDTELDAFIPPQPYNSWILNEDTCNWESPVPLPAGNKDYIWDEESQAWLEDDDL